MIVVQHSYFVCFLWSLRFSSCLSLFKLNPTRHQPISWLELERLNEHISLCTYSRTSKFCTINEWPRPSEYSYKTTMPRMSDSDRWLQRQTPYPIVAWWQSHTPNTAGWIFYDNVHWNWDSSTHFSSSTR